MPTNDGTTTQEEILREIFQSRNELENAFQASEAKVGLDMNSLTNRIVQK